jgi:predicted CoA-substrate-specific enzyme activase
MDWVIGIDIGAVSIKAALIGSEARRQQWADLAAAHPALVYLGPDELPGGVPLPPVLLTPYTRTKGQPIRAARDLLETLFGLVPAGELRGVRVTGSGGRLLGQVLNLNIENEFKAITRAVNALCPDVRTIFEMGGEKSKYILLEHDPQSGLLGIADYETSGDCAAGTGSFLDQQAGRLQFAIEDVGRIVDGAEKTAKIAGRCSVFAKSDMIHAQQKGYSPAEILKGLCEAVARNFKSSITKGKAVVPGVAFVGGVSQNSGVVRAMEDVFELKRGELVVPGRGLWLGALGAALVEWESPIHTPIADLDTLDRHLAQVQSNFSTTPRLDMEKVVLLRDRIPPYTLAGKALPVRTYLGIDIGSVSTNLVVLDEGGDVVKEIYLRTRSRPIEVVQEGLNEIKAELGDKIAICGVGTTGSGRELIGMLVGADLIMDEITAHKTGASFIGDKLLGLKVDTIFEIGGQDSKYISLQDGVVVDFAMNEACAAGTGSFLEERAEELGVKIKGEFAALALSSTAPIKLGERCTVFMEQDVNSYLQKGAAQPDVVGGLAYSIGYNYINRVVQGRHIGEVIFFQGGTAYNDAVAAAFSKILDKRVIVPPFNGVMGAVGAALLVREKVTNTGEATNFRGWDLSAVDYTLREFGCKGCTNFCSIQEFRVEEDRVYWGDKCSDRFRKRAKSKKQPVLDDLVSLRHQWLFDGYREPDGTRPVVGMPRAMYTFERFQLWQAFFRELGFDVLLSPITNRKIVLDGYDTVVAEPCFPIKVAHGHVKHLIDENVRFVFLPNIINAETPFPEVESFMCPWGQTLPFVVRSAPHFQQYEDRMLVPTLHFRDGFDAVARELFECLKGAGLKVKRKEVEAALQKGYAAQRQFTERIQTAGRAALKRLQETGEIGIILLGRTYNVNDPGVNLDVPKKLRDFYGVNVIPMDFLPVDEVDIADVNDNMFWNYGRKILAAAKLTKEHPFLHCIYITNFKCGPDSYVKHFMGRASGKPALILQFDAHSNDAGVMTRCEAYLDSKGVLRWWSKQPEKHPTQMATV